MVSKTLAVCTAVIVVVMLPACAVGGRARLDNFGLVGSASAHSDTSGLEVSERHISLLPHRRLLEKEGSGAEEEDEEKMLLDHSAELGLTGTGVRCDSFVGADASDTLDKTQPGKQLAKTAVLATVAQEATLDPTPSPTPCENAKKGKDG